MAENGRRANWKAKDWRATGGSGPRAEPGRRKPGGAKRFLLLAAVLALVGVIVGVLAWMRSPPRPLFLGVAVTEYSRPSLPTNPWGQQDSDALRQLFGVDSLQAFQGQEKAKFISELNGLVDRTTQGDDEKRPIVVHLCALGVASHGKVFLLPGLADVDAPSTWLPLEEILSTLRRCKGPCLLLLDIARPSADARLGLLSNNVSTVLDDELTRLEKSDDLKMLVLTSCERGQSAHTSLELRRSAFGFFLELGLRGAADGWFDGTTNDNVSAKELAEYTRCQVANWAAFHQLSAQTPKLYGTGADFVLIPAGKDKPVPQLPELGPPFDDYPKWLAAAWKERDDWLAGNLDRAAPRSFRQIEATVLRAEQRWLGGVDPALVEGKLNDELAELRKRRPDSLSRPPYSLAWAQRRGIKDEPGDAAAEVRLAPLLDRLQGPTPPVEADFDAALKQFVKTPPDPASFPKEAIALATLNALARLPDPTPAQLQAFDAFLSKFMPPPRYAEFFTLRLLLKLDPDQLRRWSDQKLEAAKQRVVRSANAAEQAAAIDARTLPWVKADLDAANALRRRGLHDLAEGERPQRQQGYDQLGDVQGKYAAVADAARALEQGFQSLERASVQLPALVKSFGDHGRDPNEARLWNEIHGTTLELQALLTPPAQPALPANAQNIDTLAGTLRKRLEELESQYRGVEVERQIKQATSACALRRLLESPVYSGPERAKIFLAARDRGQDREKAALAAAAKLPQRAALPSNQLPPIDDPAWRAKLAIDLLKLDGVTDTKVLEAKLKQATDKPTTEAWENLGVEIRRAWVPELAKRFRAATDPRLAIRLGYVLHPFDEGALRLPEDRFEREPAALWLREQDRQFRDWLAKNRYQADADAFRDDPSRKELVEYADSLADVATRLLR